VFNKKSEYSYIKFSNTGMVPGLARMHDEASHITKPLPAKRQYFALGDHSYAENDIAGDSDIGINRCIAHMAI
jgi:hypothetical protein